MTTQILEPALAELSAAATYYENHQRDLGLAFLDEYESCVKRIERFPLAWNPTSKNCRRALLKRFPYALIYHVDSEQILIVAIMHLHREPEYWNDRL
jgi:plasmid stabilization system protein ParE